MNARRLVLLVVAVTLAGLVFASAAFAAKPVVISEGTSEVEHPAEEARLTALVIPNGETSECNFQYVDEAEFLLTGFVTAATGPCELQNYEGGEKTIGGTVAGLTGATTYHYRVILTNASGTTEGAPAQFTTAIAPETPELKGEPTETGVKLEGVLNPKHVGSPATYEFLYERSASECTGGAGAGATTPVHSTGASPEPVETEPAGLLPNTVYTFCLRVHNGEEAAISAPVRLTTPAVAPTVGGEFFSGVGSSSAELHAQVDPGGAPTTYFFQYGATPAYGSTTPVARAGAGTEAVSVLAKVEGLQPDTPYYYRVVASNAHAAGPVYGSQITLSTFPVGLLGLPDGRSYELVSSLTNNGDATVLAYTPPTFGEQDEGPVRAAANGDAVIYPGTAPPVGGSEPQGEVNAYLAQRTGPTGWSAADIQPAGLSSAGYDSFSSDLSVGILSSTEQVIPDAPGSGYSALYSRYVNNGAYHPLFTATPPGLNTEEFSVGYEGMSGDAAHQLFLANGGLTTGAFAAHELYDSDGGQLWLVSILPDGEPDANATVAGSVTGDLERVVSEDGSRIFWTDTATGDLYVRENDTQPQSPLGLKGECKVSADACTVEVDASQGPGASGGGVYRTASSDGSKVFFTDEKQLTNDSTATAGEPDLYEYDLSTDTLADLSVNPHAGQHADVVGVLGSSEDGAYVYFASAGALANGASSQVCPPETESTYEPNSKCNLYVSHEGETRFIAAVTNHDGEGGIGRGEAFGPPGDWQPNVGARSAQVTSNGQHLIFESIEDLTGFDTEEGREIYIYDFGSGLSCVSCNPSGAPTIIGDLGQAFYVPHAELRKSDNATFMLRDISADGGRVFFDSEEALVPQDTNGRMDVYEWEREGTREDGIESCPVKIPGRVNGGCLFLLSGGTSTDKSIFIDASENGGDVFFVTRAQLVAQDHGEAFQVYDARVGASQPPTPSACTGSGCQGVPGAPPIFATPSSVTFNGVGNFSPPAPTGLKAKSKPAKCKKGVVRKKGKCVKRKAKKASRGAGRARKSGKRSVRRSK